MCVQINQTICSDADRIGSGYELHIRSRVTIPCFITSNRAPVAQVWLEGTDSQTCGLQISTPPETETTHASAIPTVKVKIWNNHDRHGSALVWAVLVAIW